MRVLWDFRLGLYDVVHFCVSYGVYEASEMIHCMIFVSGLCVIQCVWGLREVCMGPVRIGSLVNRKV